MSLKKQDNPDFEALLRSYLDICNQSLEGGASSVVKDILQAAFAGGDGQQVKFLLRDDRPKAVMNVDVAQAGLSEADSKLELGCSQKWIFDYSYLKAVVDQPDLYINEPERLDWTWLQMLAKSEQA